MSKPDKNDDGLADALLEALGMDATSSGARPAVSTLDTQTHRPPRQFDEISETDDVDVIWDVQEEIEIDNDTLLCSHCGTLSSVNNSFCGQCGAALSEGMRSQASATDLDPEPQDRAAVSVDVRLISINEDGSDGISIPLRYNETIVGRRGDTRFPTDAFLSPQHAKLLIEEGRLYIIDLLSLNGTYVRIRQEVRLEPGDCFLMGRQVLRFERFEQPIAPKARSRDGTRYMGSPPPGGSHKLLQVGIGGVYQNVYCLPEAGAVLGREKGDIIFPQDRFMSSRHAKLTPGDDGRFYLVDLNSSNGTWIKIWSRHQLEDGDLIFLGQQLFRVEGDLVAR